ncbi:hypothetical protein QCA50_015071 [Cerrena zonata]|uniref:Uncharacterized protein n=1 Tax=Cerrena zonata TaxID=2478898 RepID=A0AAW0FRP0_9APHY
MSTLTQEDADALEAYGLSMVQTLVALIVETVFYTLYLVCLIVAARILLFKRRSKATIAMFIVIFTMFLLDTAKFIIDIYNVVHTITLVLSRNSSISFAHRYMLTRNLPWAMSDLLYAFIFCLGDIVSFWRAYAFWSHGKGRWMMAIPAIPMIGTFVTSGIVSFCDAEYLKIVPIDHTYPSICYNTNIELTLYAMALLTTAFSTLLIFYKTWLYRRDIRSVLSGSQQSTRTERLMLVLIESGAIYFILCLAFLIGSTAKVENAIYGRYSSSFIGTIWVYAIGQVLGIFPALTVIIVHSKSSYLNQTMVETSPQVGARIDFATLRQSPTAVHAIEIGVHTVHEMYGMNRSTPSLIAETKRTINESASPKGLREDEGPFRV